MLKLAVFHTLSNVLGVVLILPFTNWLERALLLVLPNPASDVIRPIYLNDAALEVPDASVEAARRETLHVLDNGYEIVAHGLGLHRREIDSD
jgi:phosphate:Na+ symporter